MECAAILFCETLRGAHSRRAERCTAHADCGMRNTPRKDLAAKLEAPVRAERDVLVLQRESTRGIQRPAWPSRGARYNDGHDAVSGGGRGMASAATGRGGNRSVPVGRPRRAELRRGEATWRINGQRSTWRTPCGTWHVADHASMTRREASDVCGVQPTCGDDRDARRICAPPRYRHDQRRRSHGPRNAIRIRAHTCTEAEPAEMRERTKRGATCDKAATTRRR